MLLFDDVVRGNTDYPDQGEAAYTYLNRTGRPEAARVRQLVEDWFSRYPLYARDALYARFRAPINEHHQGAFFELFVHELLISHGHRILALEPNLAHTGKAPDFLVESQEGQRLYVECVVATGRSSQDVGAQNRQNEALTAIDRTPSPNHVLSVSVGTPPTAPISISVMTRRLRAWIAALPTDDSAGSTPPFVYEEHGATITIRGYLRRHPERAERAIGVRIYPAKTITADDDVKGAIEKKAGRYGKLDQPFVVAVNALGMFVDEDDVIDALFGSAYVAQTEDGASSERRRSNGVWCGPKGIRNKRLSALYSIERVTPWDFASRRGRVVRNPWAALPMPAFNLGSDEFRVDDGYCRKVTDGRPMNEIFKLPDGWPAT